MSRLTCGLSLLAITFLLVGCGSETTNTSPSIEPNKICSSTTLEQAMSSQLMQHSDQNFALQLSRKDKRIFIFEKGTVKTSTQLESASASKWVASVMVLRQLERGVLTLEDIPDQFIPGWAEAFKGFSNIKLVQLLSFTSGLTKTPPCINSANANFTDCVLEIARLNAAPVSEPGTVFYYGSMNHQVLASMLIKSMGKSNWQQVFQQFKAETGLFALATFDDPSINNPRVGAGMRVSASEYIDFLIKFRDGDLLSNEWMMRMQTDQLSKATIVYSPPFTEINEDWHYGLGLWLECEATQFNCTKIQYLSSPGGYGMYPFYHLDSGMVGIVARRGLLGTFPVGKSIYKDIKSLAEEWARCST